MAKRGRKKRIVTKDCVYCGGELDTTRNSNVILYCQRDCYYRARRFNSNGYLGRQLNYLEIPSTSFLRHLNAYNDIVMYKLIGIINGSLLHNHNNRQLAIEIGCAMHDIDPTMLLPISDGSTWDYRKIYTPTKWERQLEPVEGKTNLMVGIEQYLGNREDAYEKFIEMVIDSYQRGKSAYENKWKINDQKYLTAISIQRIAHTLYNNEYKGTFLDTKDSKENRWIWMLKYVCENGHSLTSDLAFLIARYFLEAGTFPIDYRTLMDEMHPEDYAYLSYLQEGDIEYPYLELNGSERTIIDQQNKIKNE